MALQIPGYKIVKTLGKGGMATVYLAVQDIFEREVALKVMSKGLSEDPAFGQRFMREAQIVSRLVHPNIVMVYDVGLHDGAYYLSMEYIRGSDLKHARKTLSFQQKITIVKQIASALDISGAKGYVHRDIKPENIMVEKGTHRAVLMDFGIARASEVDISVTQAGTAIGTPHYMSPEQAKGHEVDTRADLYSLGVVLFYLVAGYVPFEGDSAVAIGIRHITEAVPELPPHLKDLQWILDKAMAKNPDDRFQSGADFSATLGSIDIDFIANQIAEEEPVSSSAQLDSPTVISKVPVHRYGDSSRKTNTQTQSFTLSFKIDEPPALNIRWPLYMALSIVTLLTVSGVYLVATYKPEPVATAANNGAINTAAQTNLGNLILGKTQKLTPQQEAAITRLSDAIVIELQSINDAPNEQFNEQQLTKVVNQYRELLAITPNNEAVSQQLSALADSQIAKLAPTFNQGNFKDAQLILAAILKLFPKYESPELKLARSQMTLRSKIEDLLIKADTAFSGQQYVEPPGDNAHEYYQAALSLAPQLLPAKEGLVSIAQQYVSKAQKALLNAEPNEARQAIHQALTALPTYAPALEMESSILSSSSLEEKISTLMDQAQRHQKNERLFAPKTQNAFDAYTAILALDRRHAEAQEQQSSLLEKQHSIISALINKGEINAAEQAMAGILESQPNLSILQRLKKTIDEEINTYKYQSLPRIEIIRASGVGRIDLTQNQPRSIAVSNKIFFKFNYFNINNAKVLIQAQLYNHANNQSLTNKPIFVVGPSGESEFVLDLDRSGIKVGTYRLELILAGNKVAELIFRIA